MNLNIDIPDGKRRRAEILAAIDRSEASFARAKAEGSNDG
jgi:hypothetical protein